MSTPPTLDSIDTRLQHVEAKVDQIYLALVGSPNGTQKGLQTRFDTLSDRVERLESWGKWLATIVTALVITALSQLLGFKGLR
jgi:hypothetical protein